MRAGYLFLRLSTIALASLVAIFPTSLSALIAVLLARLSALVSVLLILSRLTAVLLALLAALAAVFLALLSTLVLVLFTLILVVHRVSPTFKPAHRRRFVAGQSSFLFSDATLTDSTTHERSQQQLDRRGCIFELKRGDDQTCAGKGKRLMPTRLLR